MSNQVVKDGSTNVSVRIRIIDSSDGTPEQAVTSATGGLALWYQRDGAAKVELTESDLSLLTDAHSDGGMLHIDDGYYRVDVPDAAFTGAASVLIGGAVTGMIVIGKEIQLVEYDPNDAIRLGLTALPNAAADAAGGLPISDTGGLDLDTQLAATNEITAARMGALTDWINGGRLDLILDELTTQGDTNESKIDTIGTNVDDVLVDTSTTLPAQITGLNDPTAATIADAVWDEATAGHATAGTTGKALSDTLADTNELQGDWADAGRLDAILDAVQTKSNAIETDTQDLQTQIGTAGAGLTDLGGMSTAMKAEVNTEADTALTDYDPPTNAEMEARTPTAAQLAYIVANAATGLPVTFTTSGGSTTAAVLNLVDGASASSTDDQYNGRLLVFTDGTLKGVVTDITDYDQASTTATITAIPFAPTATHNARLI